MCRGCLFVIVDIPSGGDIDGCHKIEILEELATEFPNNPLIKKKLEEMDQEKCFVGFWQPKPLSRKQLMKQDKEWLECREKMIVNYEKEMRARAKHICSECMHAIILFLAD